MKKVLLGVAGVIVLVPAVGLGYLTTMQPAQRPASAEPFASTPERVARGKYLSEVVIGCVDCHSQFDFEAYTLTATPGSEYQGGFCFTKENAGFPGKVCAQNITQDPETGLGKWTDGEIARAVREGVNREGNALFPMMPYGFLREMSDEDAASLVAYLRTIPGVKKETPEGHVDFPVSLFIKLEPKPLEAAVPHPDPKDTVKYGEYLAHIACLECHTPVNDKMQTQHDQAYQGGRVFDLAQAGGPKVVSANLTPDPETGIGQKSRENFISQFKSFADPEYRTMKIDPQHNTLMPWIRLSQMSEEDLGAIYDYLRTLPPVKKPIERRPPPAKTAAVVPAGESVSATK